MELNTINDITNPKFDTLINVLIYKVSNLGIKLVKCVEAKLNKQVK